MSESRDERWIDLIAPPLWSFMAGVVIMSVPNWLGMICAIILLAGSIFFLTKWKIVAALERRYGIKQDSDASIEKDAAI